MTLLDFLNMEADLALEEQNGRFFDVHGTHKWCQKRVWACFATPNACKTYRKRFREVLKKFGFFTKYFEDPQSWIFGEIFLEIVMLEVSGVPKSAFAIFKMAFKRAEKHICDPLSYWQEF